VLMGGGMVAPIGVRVAKGYSATEEPAELWAVTLI
jgi:hypothetical protein